MYTFEVWLPSNNNANVINWILQVDCIATTAGGIEEDLIKCMAPSYIGDFSLRGAELRKKGINRIGNLLVPNNNYCQLEEWILPVWDKMLEEQKTQVYKILDLVHYKFNNNL